MNAKTRYSAALVVILSGLSLAVAPAALASQVGGRLAPDSAWQSAPASTSSTSTLPVSDSKAPPVLLSHAAQAHAGGSQYMSASQSPPSASSGSSWDIAGIVLGALAIAAAVGLGVLLIVAATRTRRRQAIGSH
jgi:hypothetical protein